MKEEILEAVAQFTKYAQEVCRDYGEVYDIMADVIIQKQDEIHFRASAFRKNMGRPVLLVLKYTDIREMEDLKMLVKMEQEFSSELKRLSSEDYNALLARKGELEAELAAVNAKLNN